jgi:hypothetical protein
MSSLLTPNTDGGTQKWTLEKEMELRFEIVARSVAYVKVLALTLRSPC